ncbi:MAG TPA: glycoside hydrolase family 6 protein [Chloroflexota bacterium]|nr:glycoside hydrolase family 6 protein [Chloroflexota bacterium]
MPAQSLVRTACALGLMATVMVLTPAFAAAAAAPRAGMKAPTSRTLDTSTRFFIPPPDSGAIQQMFQLLRARDVKDAKLLASMEATPRAVWFTGGTPQQVRASVRKTMAEAFFERSVPVLVAYDIPGRDCAQYSAGGALTLTDYEAWVSAFAAGIGKGKAVVILEPDTLGLLPSSCGGPSTNYPFTDTDRYAELNYAVNALEQDPQASVYLDGTHSAWLNVGTIAQRLVTAGVQNAQGFFLNVSNYQYTPNLIKYGTWISDCITYATVVSPGNYSCPDQYWNGGPPSWSGVSLSPYGQWSDTATEADLNTSGEDARYAQMLGTTNPTTHFVIDTSRNGQGPNSMQAYGNSPYDQPSAVVSTLASGNWCNPPGAGLGLPPTANTGVNLLDAYLWVKTPGESDGQCDAAGGARAWDYSIYTEPGWPTTTAAQAQFDPLWGMVDPAAGDWFSQQALQLAQNANPALSWPPMGWRGHHHHHR